MRESRNEAFKTAFSTIPVTAAVEPGYFDKYDDPIKKLGEMQVHAKNIAVNMFSKSGVSPDQIKGINKVVLNTEGALTPGNAAAYVKGDSSIHVNVNGRDVYKSIAHEIGHRVNDHKTPEELHTGGLKIHNILSRVGGYEAEADHFADPKVASKNTYVHAITHHLTGACKKTHGHYTHKMLSVLGQGYLDRMKDINPGIHKQLTGGDSNGD